MPAEVAAKDSAKSAHRAHRNQVASTEIYVQDLLRREGHPWAAARKRLPAITATAAGVVALCGVMAAGVAQMSTDGKPLGAGSANVPLTVVNGDNPTSNGPTSNVLTSLAVNPTTMPTPSTIRGDLSKATSTSATAPSTKATSAPAPAQHSSVVPSTPTTAGTGPSSSPSESTTTSTTPTSTGQSTPTPTPTQSGNHGGILDGLLGPILGLL